jgi:hypothetical protein
MLAANIGNGYSALSLLQNTYDLGVGQSALLLQNLLVQNAEKILLPNPLPGRGNTVHSNLQRNLH